MWGSFSDDDSQDDDSSSSESRINGLDRGERRGLDYVAVEGEVSNSIISDPDETRRPRPLRRRNKTLTTVVQQTWLVVAGRDDTAKSTLGSDLLLGWDGYGSDNEWPCQHCRGFYILQLLFFMPID